MAATGEYTTFASLPSAPNVPAGLGAVITTVNRVNQIFENDCTVRFILVAGNQNLIFTDPATDPYAGSQAQMQAQNQSTIDTVIGTDNYDVGHVVNGIAGGGNAGGITTVCNNLNKGLGYTSTTAPAGDSFWVDYVAHEIGHQVGGTHTFNGNQVSCAGTAWSSLTAYEPGSGTSIMAYAGICGTDDINNPAPPIGASDPMFSFISIDQIRIVAGSGACSTAYTATSNHFPVPFIGQSFTIPTNTPFSLVGSASDPDFGDSISYSWEQADLGPQRPLGPDTGAHEPLLRTFMHSSDNERLFPNIITLLTGTPFLGENMPLFGRSSTFRLVVRDNVAGAGGTGSNALSLTFAPSTSGGFRVTQPSGGRVCASEPLPIVWTVAGTQNPPISCELVDITLSLDGGLTYPHALAAGIANSGFALVNLPPLGVSGARIKVSAVDNIFFSINPAPFQIQSQAPQFTGFTAWPACSTTCLGAAVVVIPSPVSGSDPIEIALQKQSGSTWSDARVISPGELFSFPSLSRSDSGNYRIAARNACGTVYTAERRIDVGVSFDSEPADLAIAPCAPAVFTVQAHGACSVQHQWLRNGVPLVGGGRVAGVTTATLTISGCRYEDEGDYSCRVTDSCEARETRAARLALTTPVWQNIPMSSAPTVAGSAEYWTTAFDEHRHVMVLYGGLTQTGQNSNALWEYDGYTWTVRQPGFPFVTTSTGQPLYDNAFPPNPSASALVYNPDDHKVYLIGPYGAIYPLAICTWDGSTGTWARPYYGPVNGETARTHAAYDRARHRIVIVRSVGGSHGAEMLIYNPATNTLAGPTPMQPQVQNGVHDAQLWYDERRGAVIWYNNLNDFVSPTMWTLGPDDTWIQLAGNPPRLRYATQVEYDPIRFQAATMGGQWDGASWYTATLAWPGLSTRPWSTTLPPANDWTILLPDGPPRNPAGAGVSPANDWSPAFWDGLVFDRHRRAMIATGRVPQANPFTYFWRTYERRYLDAVVFDKAAASEVVAPGNIVHLRSYAAGAPSLAFQWKRGGVPLADGPAAGGGTLSGTHSGTLTITGVAPADEGSYICVVTNTCGAATSSPVHLGCLGDFDHTSGLQVQDIFAYLNAWFSGDPAADLDGNGLAVQDIFDFLNLWFAGC
jgi:hypothetical protein